MLPERISHAESNGDGPIADRPLWEELSLENRSKIACFCKKKTKKKDKSLKKAKNSMFS